MQKTILLLAAAACAALTASAQDWARQAVDKSPRHREWVTVKHDGRNVEAYVAYPERKDKAPVVLVIHEIFGHSDWVEEVTDEFAAAGYIAISPDLLSGMGPNGGGTKSFGSGGVGQAIGKLPPDQITADLNAAADYALHLPAASGKLFVAGFCYGGSQTFRYATNRPDLSGAFVFYGTPPMKDSMPEKTELARIKAPVYGFFGENDNRVDSQIAPTIEAMKALGKTYEPVTYAGAGHGFMRSGEQPDAAEANHKAREEAWVRLKALLKQHS